MRHLLPRPMSLIDLQEIINSISQDNIGLVYAFLVQVFQVEGLEALICRFNSTARQLNRLA